MGGVNCPPPATQGVSPAMMDAYVDALASYSGNLFRGISQVFAANEMIETRVIARDDQFKAVSDVLDESQTSLAAAKLELGTVASLWQAMGQPPISFADQTETLQKICDQLPFAAIELSAMTVGVDVQKSLWDSGITSAMCAIVDDVTAAISWQTTFAKSSSSLLVATT